MRATQNTNFDAIRDSIHRTKSRMEHYQNETATLKKLSAPSDDPAGASKILEIRTDKMNNEQFQTNAKLAESFLNNSDHALSELSEILVRAKEIAIGQSSGASSTDETRLGVAEEVNQLFQRAIAIANTKIGDRFLFGGYRTDRPPVDDDGDYTGDNGQMMVEISKDVFLSMNVPGVDAFNTNPQTSHDGRKIFGDYTPNRSLAGEVVSDNPKGDENVNVFRELQGLRIGLLSGDLESIRNTLERFDQIAAKVVATRSKVGSRVQGLQSAIRSMERQNLTNAELSSGIEDADMVDVMNNLAKEETIFRSVLSSSQKLVQPTLMDFLK